MIDAHATNAQEARPLSKMSMEGSTKELRTFTCGPRALGREVARL